MTEPSIVLKNFEQAKNYIERKDYVDLAYDNDVWDIAIHPFLSSDMPFDVSFDEFVFFNLDTPEGIEIKLTLDSDDFQKKMLEWIDNCIINFHNSEISRLEKNYQV
jgi:hypothetical protein